MSRENRTDSINIMGQKFGLLTALNRIKIPGRRGLFWNCKCDCGKECIAYGGHLRNGQRKSCGCIFSAHIHDTGVRNIIHSYKRKSALKRREWSLSFDDVKKLAQGNCTYCGIEPRQIIKKQWNHSEPQIIYNGIDRIDSSKGYTADNCVSCCRICNQAKSTLSVEELRDHIKRMYKWLLIDS